MPTLDTKRADQVGGSAVLSVAEVVAIVREWVDLQARLLPDFAGAYLWGGDYGAARRCAVSPLP